jgi:glycosyltransferase domain-containing protein
MTEVQDYTLIVPTFNRPRQLSRLLTYLARQQVSFPVLVLDSSDEEANAENRALVAGVALDARHLTYPSSSHPFEKFWWGSQEAQTTFCSLCADDDVVMVEGLPPIVRFLAGHSDFSAAHGLYFTFYDTSHVGITSIVYAGDSYDADAPVARLRELFRRYEAVTYAVYRTDVMRDAMQRLQPARSILARELLGGALTVVAGKVARLPIGYYGRSLDPSFTYHHWHPLDFLISSPQALFDDYGTYRQILRQRLAETSEYAGDSTDLLKLVDLVHLRYLSEFVSPRMMDYLIEQVVAGTAPAEIMSGVWPRLAPSDSQALNRLWSSATLRKLRARLAPWLRQHQLRRWLSDQKDQTLTSTTFSGKSREYRLYPGFLSGLSRSKTPDAAGLIDAIVRAMNVYEAP